MAVRIHFAAEAWKSRVTPFYRFLTQFITKTSKKKQNFIEIVGKTAARYFCHVIFTSNLPAFSALDPLLIPLE